MEDFLNFLSKKADELKLNAGYAGSSHDGGARELRNNIEVFKAGLSGNIPNSWKKDYMEFKDRKDPEYLIYLSLKDKFER